MRNSDATWDVREGKKDKIQCTDNADERTARSSWAAGCMLDDIVWHQALVTLRRFDSDLCPKRKELPADQWVLYELLRHGVVDPRLRDRAFDASMRVMRYSAAVTDCVWALLDKDTTRVSLLVHSCNHLRINHS